MEQKVQQHVLTLLGFAQAAGKIASGDDATRIALTRQRGRLLLLAEDTADSTKKRLMRLSERMQVPHVVLSADRDTLGLAIGKSPRAALVVLDAQFAQAIQRSLSREEK